MSRQKSIYFLILIVFFICTVPSFAQTKLEKTKYKKKNPFVTVTDTVGIEKYNKLKEALQKEFSNTKPGKFGETVNGVYTSFDTDKKQMAFTFDACIGKKDSYNEQLINYLIEQKIPATLFVTGSWIDSNIQTVKKLAENDLFIIENHGLKHRVCSFDGKTAYKLPSTHTIGEVIDEMELNAIKIEQLTGRRPVFFRSATAFIDEGSTALAEKLNMKVVGYSLLSGDAVPFASASTIKNNLIKGAKPGKIIIMHFNHPKWNEYEALKEAIPLLRSMGYTFVRLDQVQLTEK